MSEYGLSYMGHLSGALAEAGVATWSVEYRRVGNQGGAGRALLKTWRGPPIICARLQRPIRSTSIKWSPWAILLAAISRCGSRREGFLPKTAPSIRRTLCLCAAWCRSRG